MDKQLADFKKKYYKKDFQWRYNWDEHRIRTHAELVERRDDFTYEQSLLREPDDSIRRKEMERQEKERTLKNAVKNPEFFVSLVQEMMTEGKSMIEMMVILDVEESKILDAQNTISRNEQIKKLEEYRQKMKEQQEAEAE